MDWNEVLIDFEGGEGMVGEYYFLGKDGIKR